MTDKKDQAPTTAPDPVRPLRESVLDQVNTSKGDLIKGGHDVVNTLPAPKPMPKQDGGNGNGNNK
ncbi:hypothetical protein QWZ03_18340 [Chitinimonas viridis]|uniref:Uncharacterized protein n=1 Tax=Chitinimonas viridis TaxID=664880 RepID=A0ABT8B9M0_9NEIS|nr:hypothetical protein [Chitinimonas viridis]MDN3578730.1 hypothetical protein [Chitinimonas viridis]